MITETCPRDALETSPTAYWNRNRTQVKQDAVPRRRPRPHGLERARRQDAARGAAAPGPVERQDGAHHAREGLLDCALHLVGGLC